MYYILFDSAWGLSMVTAVIVYVLLVRRLGLMSLPLAVYGTGALAVFVPGLDYVSVTVDLFGLRWLDVARCLLAVQAVGFFWSLNRIYIVENAYNNLVASIGCLSIGATLFWIFLGQHSP